MVLVFDLSSTGVNIDNTKISPGFFPTSSFFNDAKKNHAALSNTANQEP